MENLPVNNALLLSVLGICGAILMYLGGNILKAVVKLPITIERMNDMLERFNKFLAIHGEVEKDVIVLKQKSMQTEKDIHEIKVDVSKVRKGMHDTRNEVSKISGKQWMIEEKLKMDHLEDNQSNGQID